jgi:phosphohistidine swiveling domain-containing protein
MNNVEKYLKDLNTKNITKQEGNFSSMIYLSLLPECYPPFISRYYDFDFGKFLFIAKPKYGILFFDIEKYTQTSRVSFKRFLVLPTKEDFQELKDFNETAEKIIKLYDSIDLFSLEKESEEYLVQNIQNAYKLYWDLLSSSIFSEAVYEDLVKELYKSVNGDDSKFSEFFSYASLLSFESFALRFDRQLLGYSKNKNTQGSIWIFSDYYDALTSEQFIAKVSNFIEEKGGEQKIVEEISRIELEVRENKEKQKPYYNTLPLELKKLFDYMQISMELRDIRKNPLQRIITLLAYSIKTLLVKRDISSDLAPCVVYKDFFDNSYKSSEYIQELEKRQNCVVFNNTIDGLQYEFSDPDTAIQQVYKALEVHSEEVQTEIKGNPACKGLAQGPVKIILSENDFGKFTDGDILVTSMTRPEYVPLMRKAKAIITDEGGITCHAAIISRELNIPCIIGTKMATRLLKDGAMVEVDADNGIIKVINK